VIHILAAKFSFCGLAHAAPASSHDFASGREISADSKETAPTRRGHFSPLLCLFTSRVLARGRLIDLLVGIQHDIGFTRLALGSIAFYCSIALNHVRNPTCTKGSEERTEHPAEVTQQTWMYVMRN
jgi:hypothetical protein